MGLLGKLSDALADNLADLVILPIKLPTKTLDELDERLDVLFEDDDG